MMRCGRGWTAGAFVYNMLRFLFGRVSRAWIKLDLRMGYRPASKVFLAGLFIW